MNGLWDWPIKNGGCESQLPEGHQARSRGANNERESQHWPHAIREVGRPAAGAHGVHVGDRYADRYEFLLTGRQRGCEVLVRAVQNRRWQDREHEQTDPEVGYVIDLMKSWPAQETRVQQVLWEHERRARQARLSISWGQGNIHPTDLHGRVSKDAPVLRMWAIHVWEPEPPLRSEMQRPRMRTEKHGSARKRAERQQKQAQDNDKEHERVEPLEWFLLC